MEITLVILIIVAILANIILMWAFLRRKNSGAGEGGIFGTDADGAANGGSGDGLKLILDQINDLRRTMDTKLGDNS